ncbi:MAG: type II toxin-antitoxin system RelE/ParE family toxin [Planctomycetota bacterium]
MPARRDIEAALQNTLDRFGLTKHDDYRELVRLALTAIANDPEALPAKHRDDLHLDVLIFHIGRTGRKARHFFVYRIADDGVVEVARLLYDGMDIVKHLPADYLDPGD